jgi:hypothetical protein
MLVKFDGKLFPNQARKEKEQLWWSNQQALVDLFIDHHNFCVIFVHMKITVSLEMFISSVVIVRGAISIDYKKSQHDTEIWQHSSAINAYICESYFTSASP